MFVDVDRWSPYNFEGEASAVTFIGYKGDSNDLYPVLSSGYGGII